MRIDPLFPEFRRQDSGKAGGVGRIPKAGA